MIESSVPCATEKNQCGENSGLQKFNISLENVSIGIFQHLMVEILLSNVMFIRKIIGYSTYMEIPIMD